MEPVPIAREALKLYDLQDAEVTVLRHLGNLVCRVDAPDGRSYALRFCMPGVEGARLEVELSWLAALARETDLQVPAPHHNQAGEAISVLKSSGIEAPRRCILFGWLEGEPISRKMSVSGAAAIGATSARLHRHAQNWQLPVAYVGPRYDLDWLSAPRTWWCSGRARRDLGNDVFEGLVPAVDLARAAIRRLNHLPKTFGLIHSDLHLGNVLTEGDKLKVIDFDGCAFGYFLFDLAVTCIEFDDFKDGALYMEAFLTAYSDEMSAPVIAPDALDPFLIAAHLVFLEWVYTSDNASVRDQKLQLVPESMASIRKIARRQGVA